MSISLPDALPPQQLTTLQSHRAETAELRFRGFTIHLLGPQVIPAADLQQQVSRAEDLSAALRVLIQRHLQAGYPATQLSYLLNDHDLYVVISLGTVVGVEGPEPLRAYFEDLLKDSPLRDIEFEPRRVLASVHADRAGLEIAPTFKSAEGGYLLSLEPSGDRARTTTASAQFGNPGNRFTGRYFADVGLRHALATGDEFGAGWQTALSGLDDGRSDDYNEYSLGWSRVTTLGLFGLSGRLSDYDYTVSTLLGRVPAQGRFEQAEAAWLYPLSAMQTYRVIVNTKLDYTKKESKGQDGALLQRQEYGSMEAGFNVIWTPEWRDGSLDIEAGLQLRHGLGEDDSSVAQADLGYLLARPRIAAVLGVNEQWDVGFEALFQLTNDTIPEQSQWVLGGADNIAAYLPGVAFGDSGGLLLAYADYLGIDEIAGIAITPRVFVEYGYTWFEEPDPNFLRDAGTVEIADAGIGVDLRLSRSLSANVSIAQRILDRGIDTESLRASEANVLFSVSAKF